MVGSGPHFICEHIDTCSILGLNVNTYVSALLDMPLELSRVWVGSPGLQADSLSEFLLGI